MCHLNLQHPFHFSCSSTGTRKSKIPLWTPSTVPVILRLELMVFNAQGERDLACWRVITTKHRAHTMTIMIGSVLNSFNIKSGSPRLSNRIRLKILEVCSFLSQMVVLKWLLCAWIEETTSTYNVNKKDSFLIG